MVSRSEVSDLVDGIMDVIDKKLAAKAAKDKVAYPGEFHFHEDDDVARAIERLKDSINEIITAHQ